MSRGKGRKGSRSKKRKQGGNPGRPTVRSRAESSSSKSLPTAPSQVLAVPVRASREKSRIARPQSSVVDRVWTNTWFRTAGGAALIAVFGFVASGADFIVAIGHLGAPFFCGSCGTSGRLQF
jgi:hypothetical protein